MKRPSAFSDELVETHPSSEELELARQLVQAITREDLRISEYRDEYTEKVREIIDAKVAGEEVVAPPADVEQPQVVNLMEALKASVRRIGKPERDGGKRAKPGQSRSPEAEVGMIREILLPVDVWSPLVSYRPPYILDENGIIQHEPLAVLLREKGFDTDRRIECEPRGSELVFRQEEQDATARGPPRSRPRHWRPEEHAATAAGSAAAQP